MATADSFGLFWNSVNGDRKYDATSFEKWLEKFFCNGVFKDELKVSAYSGMTVKVDTGYSNVNSKVGMFTTETQITLDVANSMYPRIDTIVIERNNGNREITMHKVNGAYSGDNPQPTPPVRTGGIYQIVLAQIYVAAGASQITESDITDTRADIDLCGFVTGVVEGLANVAKSGDYNDLMNKPAGINGVYVDEFLIKIGINANSQRNRAITIGTSAQATGMGSIAIGSGMKANTTYSATAYGTNAIAIGPGAGSKQETSAKSDSISIGTLANANAGYSIAIGNRATVTNTTSIAIGDGANVTANSALAVGARTNVSANGATAIGYNSTANGTTSLAVGYTAKASGLQASSFGYSANASGANSTAIGYMATATTDNSMRLGGTALASLQSAVNLTVSSDKRDKTDIIPVKSALGFINKINVVQYVRNNRDYYMYPENELTEDEKSKRKKYELYKYDKEAHAKGLKKGERKRVGVLAQDVQKALADVYGTADYANIVDDNLHDFKDVPDDVESMLRISYSGFIPFLIKAVQELSKKIDEIGRKE